MEVAGPAGQLSPPCYVTMGVLAFGALLEEA